MLTQIVRGRLRNNLPLFQGAGNVPLHHAPRASVTPFPLPDARTASDFCAAFTRRGAGMRKSGLPRGNEFPLQRDQIKSLTLVVRLGRAPTRRYFRATGNVPLHRAPRTGRTAFPLSVRGQLFESPVDPKSIVISSVSREI